MSTICKRVFVFITLTLMSVFSVSANAADTAEGKKLYQSCVACHGDQGQGVDDLNGAALAGQYEWYLKRQLTFYKTGVRGSKPDDVIGQQMSAMSTILSEADIENVSAYLASLPVVTKVETVAGNAGKGDNKYNAQCGACHGPDAKGNVSLNAPNLSMLSAKYLTQQMKSFQKDLRGFHQDDKYGRQMKMMANTVTNDKDLNDIVAYIKSLK